MIGYVTSIEALEFIQNRFEIAYSIDDLNKALNRAFDKIETIVVRNRGEVNIFPRVNEKTVPDNIKKIQILEAHAIASNPKKDVFSDNVVSKSTGKLSVTYSDKKINGTLFLSREAYDIMMKYSQRSF